MGLQALMNVGYVHTILNNKYKLINCSSWTVVGWMAAVGKGPHFLQKNPQQNFLATGLLYTYYSYNRLQQLIK